MSEQNGTQSNPKPRPSVNDREAWAAYWREQDQLWRTEPEISEERQEELSRCQTTVLNIEEGSYPFKGMKLSRADVEWLLATHENGRGPVDWSDESQRERQGLDLRGALLSGIDLSCLPLARTIGGIPRKYWLSTTPKQKEMAAIHLEDAKTDSIHMEESELGCAHLERANCYKAHFEKSFLRDAHLERTYFRQAYLEDANFRLAHLEYNIPQKLDRPIR